MRKTIPVEIRFWNKVDKKGKDDCWNWTGYPGKTFGNPTIRYDGINRRATEVSLLIHHIDVYARHLIFRSCKNKICVNPHHLIQVEKKDYRKATGCPKRENHRAEWLKIKEKEFNRWRKGKESESFHFHMCITEKCPSRWLCKRECHPVDHPLCQTCFDVLADELRLPENEVDDFAEEEEQDNADVRIG